MPNTKNSPEYKILYFLNKRVENFKITDDVISASLDDIPQAELDATLKALTEIKYVGKKDPPNDSAWTITADGQKRLNAMQTHIDANSNARQLNRSVITIGTVIAILELLALVAQVCYQRDANQIASDQLEITKQQIQQPQAPSLQGTNSPTIQIQNYNGTCDASYSDSTRDKHP